MGMKQKKGKQKKGNWDQVPIGEEFLAQKEMESLISLEVLTDYEIVKKPDGLTEIVTNKDKFNKRKFVEDEDDSEPEQDSNDDEDMEKEEETPRKKSKNGKKQKADKKKVNEPVKTSNKKLKRSSESDASTSSWEVSENLGGWATETLGESTKWIHNRDDDDVGESHVKPKKQLEKKKQENTSLLKQKQLKKSVKSNKKDSNVQKKEVSVSSDVDVSMNEWASTLPASVLGKKDIVGAAETGSGKTLAFAIPIIHGILQFRESNSDDDSLQALILTPTRELAVQIKKHFDVAAKYARIKTVVIVGGLATVKQERLLRAKPQVVIATPGRLWELAKEGEPHLANLNKIRYLAVDETDRMVERGHFQELQSILGLLNLDETEKLNRQNFVFSATLAFTHDPPKRLQHKNHKNKQEPKKITGKEKLKQIMEMIGIRENPKIVDITSTKGTCETLQEMQINCPANKKDYYMYYFLVKHPGRTIVFCNSINTVRRLTNLFFLLKCGQVLPLHSEMHQKMRLKNLERFAEDEKSVLIATDVAARGLDISDIQHVVHYEIPKTAESYIHRSGRTARAFKGGIAIVLVEPSEIGKLKNIFQSLERDPNKMLPLFNIDATVFRQLKARVDEADKVETFEHQVRKKLADMNWMDKAKKDMDMASSDDDNDDMDDDSGNGERRQRKNLLEAKKKLDGYKRTLNKLLDDNSFMTRL
ncbi:ATP-dependent RNA helicase DDX24 [Folsomia candida]|uniref:ATP-dependent RNA helicase n=1 Tax=Folsomia candida TaxID=158441 RepID=A0A226EUC2_FOLCA|nr:ATP-dependent RNA helicase DDX24 [Folsomia candida]